jgi:uncharacterized Zn finger protein (UPF0148 family)
MSDFDKEAEREKLRKKYEQEQQEREATEKMSELLLQGATMTNAHCSECGDPIFRYEGQEFCATCERAISREDETDEDDETDGDDAEEQVAPDDGEHIEVTSPDDTRVQFGAGDADEPEDAEHEETTATSAAQTPERTQPPQQLSSSGHDQPAQQPSQTTQSQRPNHSRQVPGIDPEAAGDVTAARESLVRTLTRFSKQAEATEDPQRARESLAAAREAAEALSALRR